MNKLAAAIGPDGVPSYAGRQSVSFDRFVELIQQHAPGVLTEHEIRTLAR